MGRKPKRRNPTYRRQGVNLGTCLAIEQGKSIGKGFMGTTVAKARFEHEAVLSPGVFEQITELRIHRPGVVAQEARRRKKRPVLTRDGKLVLLALDHAARGVTQIRQDKLAMGDRHELLARARRVLADPDLDGLVASSDVLEDLFFLNYLERKQLGRSFLDGRLLVGTMNRGGIAGTVFEMDDTFTSLTAERLAELRCDGGKMMYRMDPQDHASARTMLACAQAINTLGRRKLAAFLEPQGVLRRADGYEVQRDTATMVRQCGIASALGESSLNVWLKLPYCEEFAQVGRATTLPILLLGGPARETVADTLREYADGLASSSRVRGAIIGRNLLFPTEADPLPMCRALTALVHRNASLNQALRVFEGADPTRDGARQ